MSYKIKTIASFERQAKRLIKKFPSLKNELAELGATLQDNPEQGTPLGNDCYKIRLSIASKGKGKFGGARVITNVYVSQNTVYLLSIYDKSEQSDITDKDLKELLKQII
jgi:mRNA-degrading endonuclease RelE of RelBE toxin-antitoxin system